MPKFSILIPTRNRAEWLRRCLQAVVGQDYADYEVIVADNSSEEQVSETRRVVEAINSCKVRYIRTGGLTMPDNWQRALEESKGEYFLVLSDKLLAADGLLSFLDYRAQKDGFDVATWRLLHEDKLTSLADHHGMEPEIVPAKDLWHSAGMGWWSLLHTAGARGMNSCVRREIAMRVEQDLGVRFFRPTCPDYTMLLTLAAFGVASHFYNIVGAGFIMGADGNGMFCLMAPNEETVAKQFDFPSLEGLPLPFAHGTNLIYQDILAVNRLVPPEKRCVINWENYFIQNIHKAVDADDMGGLSPERQRILQYTLAQRPLKERLSLAKTIFRQEAEILLRNKRLTRRYQWWRMRRLMAYALKALIPAHE